MSIKHLLMGATLLAGMQSVAFGQGTVRGAEQGADRGGAAGGPVGAVVGGAVGAATGTVNGVLGVGGRGGCTSRSTTRTDNVGNSETVKRTDCP